MQRRQTTPEPIRGTYARNDGLARRSSFQTFPGPCPLEREDENAVEEEYPIVGGLQSIVSRSIIEVSNPCQGAHAFLEERQAAPDFKPPADRAQRA
jgi:hypothetical protein